MDQPGGMGQAFGAGMAGGKFDPVAYAKKPSVILLFLCLLFSVIVFGCIVSEGWYYPQGDQGPAVCKFADSDGTCSFGTFVGVIAFLLAIGLLALAAYFEQISSVQHRKYAVYGEMGVSAFLTFFFFICFCVLTNKVTNANPAVEHLSDPNAAVAFSFFSIFTWAGVAFFAWRRYQQGAATAFAPSGFDQDAGGAAYPGYAGGISDDMAGGGGYQEPPFSASNAAAQPQYQQPAY